MKTIRNATAAALLSGTAMTTLLMLPSEAGACGCINYNAPHVESTVNSSTVRIIGDLTTQINAMQLAIVEAMRLQTGQLSANIKEQTAASHNLADIQDDRAVVARIEEARLAATKEAASAAATCNVMSGTGSGSGLRRQVSQVTQGFTKEMVDWRLGANGSPSSKGSDVATKDRIRRHCTAYGTEEDVLQGICSVEQIPEDSDGTKPDIDIAQSLMYAENGGTATLSEERVKAARGFIVNAIDPIPEGPMLPNTGATAAGREEAARRLSTASRRSVASNAVNDILSRRIAQPDSRMVVNDDGQDVTLREWAEGTAAMLFGYDPDGNNFPNGVSWQDWMELRSNAWYMNPNWMVAMDTNSPDQAIKDSTIIQAFQVYQNWETYKLLQNISTTLATMLAMQDEQNND